MAPPDTSGNCYQTCPERPGLKRRLVAGARFSHPRTVPPKPRDLSPGIHHVWVNATSHWDYFLDDVDRLDWLRLLVKVCARKRWTPLAFCQMTTHVHVLVDVPDASLGEGMRYLNREYSLDFNARHARAGYLVRRRYGSRRIEGGRDLLGAYAYVVLNPVEAGICSRPGDWRWSSYATTVGLSSDFAFVDASLAVGEAGGIEGLERVVSGRAAEVVRKRHVRQLLPDVAG